MRWAIYFLPAILAGCVTDNGSAFLNSTAAFQGAFTTQDNLEVDLMKDLVRKSNELEFVSNHTYSCGDPNDRYMVDAEFDYRSLDSRFAKKKGYDELLQAYKKQREKNDLLKAIAEYGATIKAIAGGFQTAQDDLSTIQKDVDTLKGGVLSASSGILTALSAVLKIAAGATAMGEEVAIHEAAVRMQSDLQDTAKKLKNEHVLASLSEPEATAFNYWDACAIERLTFIRDYFPSYYKPTPSALYNSNDGNHLRFQGAERTSVLDFAKEYRQYLLDREAFIARRPNYSDLIDAIVKANADIVKASPQDVLAAASQLTNLTSSLPSTSTAATATKTAATTNKPASGTSKKL